jgi:4-amino-4-deoxy-L-arabinose transferase-like glycosyltransferase
VLVCVGCLAPFANKAYTIDDPLFLWAAQHIQEDPFHPYRFTVNWYGWPQEMADNTKNPPLMPYVLAAAASAVGWNETALHLVCLLFAAGVAWGTYRLAEELYSRPLVASLAAVLTPVFLVSSTNVMCDTLMVCFWVWAVVCWRRGLDRPGWLFVAAVLVCMCALTKYFGVSLIPLLLVYTLAARLPFGRGGSWKRSWQTIRLPLFALFIPITALCAYEALTRRPYGNGLLVDAAGFAIGWRGSNVAERLRAPLIGLVFTGGCLAGLLFYLPLLWSRRALGVGIVLTAGLLAPALALGRLGQYPLRADTLTDERAFSAAAVWCSYVQIHTGQALAPGPAAYALGMSETVVRTSGPQGWDWPAVLHAAAFMLVGVGVVALAVADLWRHRDANALLLFLWAAGTWLFAVEFNWVINGRSLLPLAPVVGILVARRLDPQRGPGTGAWVSSEAWPLVGAAVVALAVTAADYCQADADRTAARAIVSRCAGQSRELWLEGHWGFQYYLQRAGAANVDISAYHFRPGDRLVLPGNNYGLAYQPPSWLARDVLTLEVPCFPWLTTLRMGQGAGFYSHEIGPFPFLIGPCAPVSYRVVEFLEEVR